LKNEPQNKGKLDDYKEFNIRLADKSDQYFNDKDETKTALTTGDIREA